MPAGPAGLLASAAEVVGTVAGCDRLVSELLGFWLELGNAGLVGLNFGISVLATAVSGFFTERQVAPRRAAGTAADGDGQKSHHGDPANCGSHGRKHLYLVREPSAPPLAAFDFTVERYISARGILVPEDVLEKSCARCGPPRDVRPLGAYS